MSAETNAEEAAIADAPDAPDAPVTDGPDGGASAHPRGTRSSGALIALGLGVVVVVAALMVAIVGGDAVSATAVRVNTFEVSQKKFNSQLRQLAPVLRDNGAPATESTDAFVPTSSSAQLAQVYVMSEVLRGHVKITDADRSSITAGSEKTLARFTPGIRSRIIDLAAMQQKLVDDRGEGTALRVMARLARTADVHVDPRYGIWHPLAAQVCAPTGCPTNAASGG